MFKFLILHLAFKAFGDVKFLFRIRNSLYDLSSALQALMKRNTDLTPSQTEQTAITNLVNKIQAVLDGLIVSPGNFEACVSATFQPYCIHNGTVTCAQMCASKTQAVLSHFLGP